MANLEQLWKEYTSTAETDPRKERQLTEIINLSKL